MRAMTYRIELDADNGYVISNADESWEVMPTQKNFTHPPIKVSNAPFQGQIECNIDDYVKLSGAYEDTDAYFRENYLKALHGEDEDWWLVAVSIGRCNITMLFANRVTHEYELLRVLPAPFLRVWLTTQQEDGSADRYLLTWVEADSSGERYSLRVMEYGPHGRRMVHFDRGVGYDAKCPDPHWEYAYVTEYR